MIKADDICYVPTKNMCRIKEHLSEDFFPDNQHEIVRQEIVTYRRKEGRLFKTTFSRVFIENWHTDTTTEECIG
jgi:hypothetical protein